MKFQANFPLVKYVVIFRCLSVETILWKTTLKENIICRDFSDAK